MLHHITFFLGINIICIHAQKFKVVKKKVRKWEGKHFCIIPPPRGNLCYSSDIETVPTVSLSAGPLLREGSQARAASTIYDTEGPWGGQGLKQLTGTCCSLFSQLTGWPAIHGLPKTVHVSTESPPPGEFLSPHPSSWWLLVGTLADVSAFWNFPEPVKIK